MMRFSASVTRLTLVAAAGLAACHRAATGPVVGFAQIGGESNWRTAETRSMREEAERRGIHLRIADAQQRQENQIKALRGFIAQGVDVILLAPMEKNGWEPVLREVKEAGIPLVLVDRGVAVSDEGLYATLIASDFVEEGRMAARWLVEATGGTCNVVELQGSVGSDPAIERRNGFLEVLAQHQGMSVLRSQSAEFTRSRGKEVMEAFIKAEGKGIQAVYAHNDDMALGAIQALEEAGMRPGKDVLVVSIDGIRDAFEAMAAGKLNATVECNPLLGPLAFDAIERILRGEPVEKRVIVEDRLFTADQAAAELPNRKY
ncbi:MAG TPA: ABC transporter substrate-binding protein [Planctomycetota bacterium]|nr:ABC transporter substrate-binding protein [Planctomycetota bacterium]